MRFAVFAVLIAIAPSVRANRLKELVEVEGFRPNQLMGVGLVVGLAGTGDDTSSIGTRRALSNVLRMLNVVVDQTEIKARNVAAVALTANLPPFARPGMAIDVTVSSIGTSKSLQGGTLIRASLQGPDRQVYALAQGSLTVGGFEVEGASGSGTRKNHVTAARIPGGARVEREAPGTIAKSEVVLLLRDPDFTTASRIAAAIAPGLHDGTTAQVKDPTAVTVSASAKWIGHMVDFIAAVEAIDAIPDAPARVIVDERTGTIVVGATVTLAAAAIAHGGIMVHVSEHRAVSQPGPLSRGQTTVAPETEVSVEEKEGQLAPLPAAATVGDVAAALNALKVKPRDLVAIFQALKAAGALRAEIQVM